MNEVIEPVTEDLVSIQIIVSEELIGQGCFPYIGYLFSLTQFFISPEAFNSTFSLHLSDKEYVCYYYFRHTTNSPIPYKSRRLLLPYV